jgi:lipoprotein-anchoring transpeptidase ErfK/SrfK
MRQTITKKQRSRASWIAVSVLILGNSLLAQTTSQRQIVISLMDRKLTLVENGEIIKVYPVAVGRRSTPSPTGKFKVVNRVSNPTYYHTGRAVPPGPQNPLGTRWMGLSQKGYGIHGTNAPRSVGKAASHGCIRMARADLEELFTLVRVGDPVEIRETRGEQSAGIPGTKPEETGTGTQYARVLAGNSTQPAGSGQ